MDAKQKVELLKKIHMQRDEILSAFIAKYKLQPEEVEQVIVTHRDGIRFYVRKRERD